MVMLNKPKKVLTMNKDFEHICRIACYKSGAIYRGTQESTVEAIPELLTEMTELFGIKHFRQLAEHDEEYLIYFEPKGVHQPTTLALWASEFNRGSIRLKLKNAGY